MDLRDAIHSLTHQPILIGRYLTRRLIGPIGLAFQLAAVQALIRIVPKGWRHCIVSDTRSST
jgi:hypothetical protein